MVARSALVLVGCASGEAGTPTTSGADSPPMSDVGVLLDGVERITRILADVSEADFERRPTTSRPATRSSNRTSGSSTSCGCSPGSASATGTTASFRSTRARRRAQPASRASVRVRRRALRRGRDRSPRSDRGAGGGDRRSPGGRVRALVEPLVPRDRLGLAARVPGSCLVRGAARARGIVSADEAELGLVSPGGQRGKCPRSGSSGLRLQRGLSRPLPPARSPGPPARPEPPYLARREERWLSTLDGGRIVYVGTTSPSGTSDFADELRRQARRPTVERVVLDLRHNPGRDNDLRTAARGARRRGTSSCSSGARPSLRGQSSSSSKSAPNRLRRRALGRKPEDLYGDTIAVTLPDSGWSAQIAAVHWAPAGEDPRLAFEPDVPVELTSGDFFAGRDPAQRCAASSASLTRRSASSLCSRRTAV